MQYTEAYLLALLEGNSSPTVPTLAIVFARAALKFDPKEAKKVINANKGKTAKQLLVEGVQIPNVQLKSQSRQSDDDDEHGFSGGRCLMFFPTSGRMGFEKVETTNDLPSLETVREMIAYESQLRLSEAIQELIEFYHMDERAVT